MFDGRIIHTFWLRRSRDLDQRNYDRLGSTTSLVRQDVFDLLGCVVLVVIMPAINIFWADEPTSIIREIIHTPWVSTSSGSSRIVSEIACILWHIAIDYSIRAVTYERDLQYFP